MSGQRFPDGRNAYSFADMTEALSQVPSVGIEQQNWQSSVFPASSSSGFQHSHPFMIPSANNVGFQYSAESAAPVYGQSPAPTFSFANINATLPQMTWGYNGIPGQNPQTFAIPCRNNVGFQYSGSASAFHKPSTSVPHGYVPSMMQNPIWSAPATFDHSIPVSTNSYETVQVWRPFLPPPTKQIVPIMPSSETFSCKVFVGGLPSDITGDKLPILVWLAFKPLILPCIGKSHLQFIGEQQILPMYYRYHIARHFRPFGPLVVDWPHKDQGATPKGYAFLLYQNEFSVHSLIDTCSIDENRKLYFAVSSGAVLHKRVQVRPWLLTDAKFCPDRSLPIDPRKTVFIGGVLRPATAPYIAELMSTLFGAVAYAEIDVDSDFKYPKGAARVAFYEHNSYVAAVQKGFIDLSLDGMEKKAEIKAYVMDNQQCDECDGARCNKCAAPYFCIDHSCLQYYCRPCWYRIHNQRGKENHKMLQREPVVERRF